VKLEDVVPWGRSLDEYVGMFDLSPADLAGRILDCGGGPASFTVEATERGLHVTACDPIYHFSGPEIRTRVEAIAPAMVADMEDERDGYIWDQLGSPAEVGRRRQAAMRRFVADLPAGLAGGRYIDASLPSLPFPDNSFDLALSSHLLFLYATQRSSEFHLSSVAELIRVAREVRIFPLIDLAGDRSVHVEAVIAAVQAAGHPAKIVRVPYEFRRGANEMLRIRRAGRP